MNDSVSFAPLRARDLLSVRDTFMNVILELFNLKDSYVSILFVSKRERERELYYIVLLFQMDFNVSLSFKEVDFILET